MGSIFFSQTMKPSKWKNINIYEYVCRFNSKLMGEPGLIFCQSGSFVTNSRQCLSSRLSGPTDMVSSRYNSRPALCDLCPMKGSYKAFDY